MLGIELSFPLVIASILILAEQAKRSNPIKIISSTIFFVICFEMYEFESSIPNIFIVGPIVIFFFYETVERLDRYILSGISYLIVGALLEGKGYTKLGYTVVHWLGVRLLLLYVVFLPMFDVNWVIIIFTISGIGIFISTWLNIFDIIDYPTDLELKE